MDVNQAVKRNAACVGCHQTLDPLAEAFNEYLHEVRGYINDVIGNPASVFHNPRAIEPKPGLTASRRADRGGEDDLVLPGRDALACVSRLRLPPCCRVPSRSTVLRLAYCCIRGT